LITGGGRGLGAEIARHFVAEGASVAICARTLDELNAVEADLKAMLRPQRRLLVLQADVADEAQVDDLFRHALDAFPHLDIVVNNAGVYGPLGPLEETGWDAWREAIAINLMGTVYVSRLAIPQFKARRYGKIINLSGGGATNPLPFISAYAASKAAVVRFTETLSEELKAWNIDVNSVAPGPLATRLNEELLNADPELVGAEFHARMVSSLAEGGVPLATPAELCVYLASAASDGVTGRLISAVWDPWPFSDAVRADLDRSDIYTLRRITPSDRGKPWGEQ
jgi:3-oxoacyl-[acyl-carrier protein] reductase